MSQTHAGEDKPVDVFAVKHKQTNNKGTSQNQRKNTNSRKQCRNCGGIHDPKKCPAYGKTCNNCKKRNHFASVCMSVKPQMTKPRKLNTVDVETDADDDHKLYVATLETVNTLQFDEWSETIYINNVPVEFQLDTGAKCNVISLSTLKVVCPAEVKIQKQEVSLRSYSGHLIKPMGVASLTCRYRDQDFHVNFYIVKGDVQAVLGAKAFQEMQMLKRIFNLTTSTSMPDNIAKTYKHLFQGLGCLPGMHTIQVDKTISPVVHPPRKIPIAIKVKAELDRMTEMGVVVNQEEPADWVNSMVTVIKPNGKIRICIDPIYLSQCILREHYPLKTV